AYYVAEQPTFFTIDDSGGEDGFCNMVAGIPDSSSEDDRDMAQDDGRTELDDRRKAAAARSGYLSTSDWDYIEPPLPSAFGDSTAFLLPETKPTKKKHNKVEDQVPVTIHVPKEDVEEIKVKTLAEAQPARLQDLRLRELQCDCDRWGIATSGTKAEVQDRLERLYAGQAVKKKNCTKKFVRLVAWGAAVSTSSPGTAPTTRTPATAARRSTTTTSSTSSAATVGEQPKIGGTFRYSGGSPQEATICPRTGLEVPRGMEIGGPVPNLSCMACGVPMVLRRRRDGTAFFFGISNFPTARSCKYTLELDEGLAMVQTKGKHGHKKPQTENLEHAYAGTTLDRHSLRDEGREPDELNEARLALVDTACTSCLHSRAWREAYQQTLPTGLECRATSNQKTFHFANGQSSDGRLQVWSIPVFLGGVRGEIHSAEMPEGTTPMLLSIPAMDALDMILFVKKRQAKIESLGLRVPLLQTRTKHLAIEIAHRPQDDKGHHGRGQPRLCSESGDLFVYYSEEARYPLLCHDPPYDVPAAFVTKEAGAPDLGTRGVRAGDKTGQLTQRRAQELQQAWGKQHRQDKRAKVALCRDYTMAEQWATSGFQDTCLFEPFARDAVLTKVGIKEMAWTCSSP
ncbi:dnaaf1, partial [Symbiodinium microadriaticum]